MERCADIMYMSEYIKNVLYFATVKHGKELRNTPDTHYFCIDNELVYENYYNDFGPLNLGCVYRYCKILNEKLKEYLNKQFIVHYTSIEPKRKANAAFLLGCFGVLYLSLTPKDALKPLLMYGQNYKHFQDATQGESSCTISITDCLQAIKKAKELGFFNFYDFNYDEYERLNKIQGGDLNWIIPGKFVAFIGPVNYNISLYHPPEMYLDYFLENNVKIVIRLNKKMYDANIFKDVGISHFDLFFPDGGCPPRHILFKFLEICEDSDCAIGVHCKAGLGRTGSLIGCYLIKHYRMSAHEAIAWMRICRPGSVIGHQQNWLEQLEPWLMKQGNIYRKQMYHDCDRLPTHDFGVYSIRERTHNRSPVVCTKAPSPPPPMQRQTRSDISSQPRPQASKTRQVPNKKTTKEPCINCLSPPKPYVVKSRYKGDQKDAGSTSSRQATGSGDPRVRSSPTSSRGSSPKPSSQAFAKYLYMDIDKNAKPIGRSRPVHTYREVISAVNSKTHEFRMSSIAPMKTVCNASNTLMVSTFEQKRYDEKGVNQRSPLMVNLHQPSRFSNNTTTEKPISRQPSMYSAGSRGNRRRLGRSPSPSPPQSKQKLDQSRATNTQPVHKLGKDGSVTALKEALSRLKVNKPREQSIGAASLGARREAPAPRQAPSVRSDEQPLATQGDMLNSIKLQRRFKEVLQNNKDMHSNLLFAMSREKQTLLQKPNSRTSTATRPAYYRRDSFNTLNNKCNSKDKCITDTAKFSTMARPSSPKGMRKTLL